MIIKEKKLYAQITKYQCVQENTIYLNDNTIIYLYTLAGSVKIKSLHFMFKFLYKSFLFYQPHSCHFFLSFFAFIFLILPFITFFHFFLVIFFFTVIFFLQFFFFILAECNQVFSQVGLHNSQVEKQLDIQLQLLPRKCIIITIILVKMQT